MTDFNSLISNKSQALVAQSFAKTNMQTSRRSFCEALKNWGLHDDLEEHLGAKPAILKAKHSTPAPAVIPGTPDLNALAISYQAALSGYINATNLVQTVSDALNNALLLSGIIA